MLRVLGAAPGPVMEACVLDFSGSGLRLRTPLQIPCGAPVRVDAQDLLMLGEICRCQPDHGAYTVGVRLSHSFTALAELERLNRALVAYSATEPLKVHTR